MARWTVISLCFGLALAAAVSGLSDDVPSVAEVAKTGQAEFESQPKASVELQADRLPQPALDRKVADDDIHEPLIDGIERKERAAAAEIASVSSASNQQQHPLVPVAANQPLQTYLNVALNVESGKDGDRPLHANDTTTSVDEPATSSTTPVAIATQSTAFLSTTTPATATSPLVEDTDYMAVPETVHPSEDAEDAIIPLNDSPELPPSTTKSLLSEDQDSDSSNQASTDRPEEVEKGAADDNVTTSTTARPVNVTGTAEKDEPFDGQSFNQQRAVIEGAVSTTRPSGRALSHDEDPVPWEAMSTKVIGTIIEDIQPLSNKAAAATASALTTGTIAAIVMCFSFMIVATAGLSGYWWYRKRYMNHPETLSERYAPSETGAAGGSSGGDDIFRVGYIHSPEMPRDSSEEMYSLDNDSFLTSLEAMTIPTYWTENIKHTKL